jgi:hypothetical protein
MQCRKRGFVRWLWRARIAGAAWLILLWIAAAPASRGSDAIPEAIRRGESFLTNLFNPTLDLLPEYKGAKVYWLYHDNYLAAKVLAVHHPKMSERIFAGIRREGVEGSGKIEILFGEAPSPLPFRQYELKDVRRAGERVIRTEAVTARPLGGWREYADLLLMAALAEQDAAAAREDWTAAMRMWDGRGFMDAATRHSRLYSTYKLALALLAARHLSPAPAVPPGLLEKLLNLQAPSGGWITDYDEAGEKRGLANVETTSLAILGLRARGSH